MLRQEASVGAGSRPLVSVVVPTYRRPDLLARCLEALEAQTVDRGSFEIVVADDAASPETERQVKQWAAEHGPAIRYVTPIDGRGPAAARNAGWRAATAPVIAFTDDDCVPQPQWLEQGLKVMTRGTSGAWGRLIMPTRPGVPTDYEKDASHLQTAVFVTANCFCRKEALETVGGFDQRFTSPWREDSDLFFNLLEGQHRVTYAPKAVVVHPIRPAPWGVSLAQQPKSMFNALLYRKHPVLFRRMIQAGPPWHYYQAIAALGLATAAAVTGHRTVAVAGAGLWTLFTARFCGRRLENTSRAPSHVAEMLVTSALIPPLSIFWRIRGALKFRSFFF